MIRNYFDTKPCTVLVGAYRRGKYVVFVTFGVKEYSGDEQDCAYTGCICRFELMSLDIQELIASMSKEFILQASEDELCTLMRTFGVFDNIDAWATLRSFQVAAYDVSDNVNSFLFDGQKCWLDKNTRVGLANMYRLSEQWEDEEIPQLWLGSIPVDVGTAQNALALLSQIEQYALQCYSITQRHLVGIENCRKINDLEALQRFDITADYPEPIIIKL